MIPIASAAELAALLARLTGVAKIAVDSEGNGWHAYRARLCVLQLAWREGEDLAIAIVDPLAVDCGPLGELLGPAGPVKVLHDLGFDARLLADAGLRLGNVRDTAIAAQLCGEARTGLANLLESRLGVRVEKGLQDHDWAERPLGDGELFYLAQDVRHLLALDASLASEEATRDIAEEVALECEVKLASALVPPPPAPLPHERIKGWRDLPAPGRAALARLASAREALAEAADVPPFRVARSEMLVDLARRRPRDAAQVARVCGRRAGGEHAAIWAEAIARAGDDADAPVTPQPERKPEPPRRLRRALSDWRQAEAELRAVSPQVVLPGRCLDAVAFAIAGDPEAYPRALEAVEGLGTRRIARYREAWQGLREPGTD
jgi:ribonuclease D